MSQGETHGLSAPREWASAGDTSQWRRRTLLLVGGLFLFRLLYAVLTPLDLAVDEAYYWDWSRHLDWGYYSKPPLVAWLIALSTALGGSSALMVRLPAVVLGTCGLLTMYALGERLYGPKAGYWAALLTAATPGNAALSFLMTIDAPFLFFWCASLLALWRMLEPGAPRGSWLLVATLATGLGLLSKQTMLGFIPLAGIFLLSSRQDRRELARPAFWLWAVGSLLFLTPVLWWNSQHGWTTVTHTQNHFQEVSVGLGRRLTLCGEFLGAQFGLASPVTCALLAVVTIAAARALPQLGRREKYLVCFSGLPLAGVVLLSLRQRVEPNWPAAFYPAGIVLVIGWALGYVEAQSRLRLSETSLRRAAVCGAVCVALTYVATIGGGLQGTRLDPMVRLRGWNQFGIEVGERLAALPSPQKSFVLVPRDRALVSELAFNMPGQPRVYLWNGSEEISSQYEIWGGPRHCDGWDALIVTSKNDALPQRVIDAFERIETLEDARVDITERRRHHANVYRGVGFRRSGTARIASTTAR